MIYCGLSMSLFLQFYHPFQVVDMKKDFALDETDVDRCVNLIRAVAKMEFMVS